MNPCICGFSIGGGWEVGRQSATLRVSLFPLVEDRFPEKGAAGNPEQTALTAAAGWAQGLRVGTSSVSCMCISSKGQPKRCSFPLYFWSLDLK